MDAMQKGIFSILSTKQSTPVYDDVPSVMYDEDGALMLDEDENPIPVKLPYITLGAFTCKASGNKTVDMSEISQQIHIWSEYSGKTEVNGIANDITAVLTSWPIDLSADGFEVTSQDVDFFEAFASKSDGYHGVLTFVSKIQNIGE